jgi:hypothetical protein
LAGGDVVLKELRLRNVGPVPVFDIELGDRLNLFTGDNGLGKTFLLDVIWWALTGTWAGNPAWPQRGKDEPTITYRVISEMGEVGPITSKFDFKSQRWTKPAEFRVSIPSLAIYVRVDGGFSVWDQARSSTGFSVPLSPPATFGQARSGAYHFTPDTLWNGLQENGKALCNGLIDDWVRWQYQPSQHRTSPFKVLSRVIERLSPHPSEWMRPGAPTRVSIEDVRDIPTIDLPYGNIPVIYASAGMKRILGLAYLLVWTWYEHIQASQLLNREPTDRLVLLMDEVEAHLHPRWQRSLLPAMLDAVTELQREIKTQVVVTTHSPLVLASVEPHFDDTLDKLFLFDLKDSKEVTLTQISWAKQGDVVGWLTSEVFGLQQARSREAELTIETAEAFMRGEVMDQYPEHLRTKAQIHQELLRLLPGHDPFWPRWLVETDLLPKREAVKSQ